MNSPRPEAFTPRLAPPPVYVQPTPTQPMTVRGNLNALNKPFGTDGHREWSHGLCSCFDDCGTCLMSWCCPCIQFGQNKQRYEHLREHGKADPHNGGFFNSGCAMHFCFAIFGLQCIPQLITRGNIRGRYSIRGGGCKDFCTSMWCAPCALAQESRELQLEEDSFQMRQLR